MCGIAGAWSSTNGSGRNEFRTTLMMDAIAHRGPDSFGHWAATEGDLCLGHRRLAIQDLSPLGHQPMLSRSQRFVIVFNGEIYNFHALKSELQCDGFVFRGHSDTEVMLAAFEKWGVRQAVERFSGMFAFAVFDQHDNALWLARDRMGEKPLYLYCDGGEILFSSELKSLLAGLGRKLDLDRAAIGEYFRYGYFSTTATPFDAIKKLPPASIVRVSLSELAELKSTTALLDRAEIYWRADKAGTPALDEQSALRQFRALMERVVTEQVIADVDVGVFLSGGIDSSLVAAVLQAKSTRPIQTFTIAFDHQSYNEGPFAAEIAAHLGTQHTQIDLSTSACLDAIERLHTLLDEPFADASLIPTYLVSQAARNHVTVCLSGDGGDELFAGYNRYRWGDKVWGLVKSIPAPLRKLASQAILGVPADWYDSAYLFVAAIIRATGRTPEKDLGLKVHKIGRLLAARSGQYVYADLLSFWHLNPLASNHVVGLGGVSAVDDQRFDTEFVEAAMECDRQFYLPCDNLFKVDRAAMANSLEVRLPLLDHRVVEFAVPLPTRLKLRDRTTKYLMRQLLYSYVPQTLLDRPKMGFSVPLGDWLRGPLKGWADNILGDADLLAFAGMNPSLVNATWRSHQAGRSDHANAIWTVLTYLLWFRNNLSYIKEQAIR